MAPKFGTSGLRGLVSELTDPLCAAYARAFLLGTDHEGTLLIGHDLRPSSRRHLAAVAAGARAAGVTPLDCGALPTPALALEGQRRGAPAIMVTGSHIPADRNGLKFYTRTGEITKNDEAAIAARLDSWEDGAAATADADPAPGADARYLDRFTAFFPANALAGLKVGVYEHSAVGRDLLKTALAALGAKVVGLARSESFIPVDTEAVDRGMRARLAAWAEEHRLDAIASLDGDADRPLLTDSAGRLVPGDILGPLTARRLGADTVVTPVSSNTLVDAMGFARVARTRIGSPFVIAGIEAARADSAARPVGYEANGGFLTGFDAVSQDGRTLPALMTRDALLPILSVLSEVAGHGPLADLVAALPPRRTAADRLTGIATEISGPLISALTQDAAARAAVLGDLGPEAGIDITDGLRITFESGEIVHLRPSGNAPELRCYCEAASDARAAELLSATLAKLARQVG